MKNLITIGLPSKGRLKDKSVDYLKERGLKILRNFKERNYFAKIENFLSKEKCKEIISIVDIYLKENDHKIWREDDSYCDLRLFGAEKIDRLIYEYYNNEKILKVGNLHIKSSLKNIYTLAGKTSFVEKNNFGQIFW